MLLASGDLGVQIEESLSSRARQAALGLDRWLDSMRTEGGYGGPVVHWWWDCLDYTGPGLDWRYEGIIIGYLNLWSVTGDTQWLSKARRAGDDLVQGQLPSGSFRNSGFELNPSSAGTPHEAACDLALLRLAGVIRLHDAAAWKKYFEAAEKNLNQIFIKRFWQPGERYFRDDPVITSFVPNKAASLTEALTAYAEQANQPGWLAQYILPTLDAILAHQVSGGKLDGAIAQNSFGSRRVDKYFPFYVARCIPALVRGWEMTSEKRYADGARRAAEFVLRARNQNGSFQQVIYPNGRLNPYPRWVAGSGDMLRTLNSAQSVGFEYDPRPTMEWLLTGMRVEGGIRTADGFGMITPGKPKNDPRDDIRACGWSDKAFRFLTSAIQVN